MGSAINEFKTPTEYFKATIFFLKQKYTNLIFYKHFHCRKTTKFRVHDFK